MSSGEINTKSSKRSWRALNNIGHKLTYSTTNILFWSNKNKKKNNEGRGSDNNIKCDNNDDDNVKRISKKNLGIKPEDSGRFERSPIVVHGVDRRDSSTDYLIESYQLSMRKQKDSISINNNNDEGRSHRTQSVDRIFNDNFPKGEAYSVEHLHPYYLSKNKSTNEIHKTNSSLSAITRNIDSSYSDILNSEEISQEILFWLKTQDASAYKMEKHERLQAMLSG
uniref:Homeobox protein 2-like n=1 Tax=Parastrongyloides trichosuri TaxID=131310 RepID=A0A0N5A2G9_PARTI